MNTSTALRADPDPFARDVLRDLCMSTGEALFDHEVPAWFMIMQWFGSRSRSYSGSYSRSGSGSYSDSGSGSC